MLKVPKTALITGVTGQDGAYLAAFLLAKGYHVHGVIRRTSGSNMERLSACSGHERFHVHVGDVTDSHNILSIIKAAQPDKIYNFAAQSDVAASFHLPEYTAHTDALGPLRILDAIRLLGMERRVRFFQASTSELFGKVRATPQNETTPFYPRSPYAAAKVYAYWMTVNYREAYGMYAVNGIMFNHESPTRGEEFVTRKITKGVARIMAGRADYLTLGNLEAKRDWGYAPDYVRGVWAMLQQDMPDDFVLATGENHTVREFVELAFREVGVDLAWSGAGVDEVGRDARTGRMLVCVDPQYFRPAEVDVLCGDASKAKRILGWQPTITFRQLVAEMVAADMERENACMPHGWERDAGTRHTAFGT